MKNTWKFPLIVCGAAFALSAAIAVLPSGTLVDNNDVRVVRALEKAHVKGSFHEHKMNRVMVYLQPGRQRFEYQDGRKPAVFEWKAGQVVFSKPEGMHSPEVVSDEPFNIIEIELKKHGTGNPVNHPVKLNAKGLKLEFENDQVRVLRVKLGAHQSVPVPDSSWNSVAIFLTDHGPHKAGDAIWQGPAEPKIDNSGSEPLEMVLVQVRA